MSKMLRPHSGQFRSGDEHPRASNLTDIEAELTSMDLGTRTVVSGSIFLDGGHRKFLARCSVCNETHVLFVDNVRAGKSKGCRCQRTAGKYRDDRADKLGARYDAMVQRCTRDTHVSSENYKGRGIKVLFGRQDFIRWALAKFPTTDFAGLDFDRIDNDGHYSFENLRLVSRSENLRNTRRSKR